MKEELDKKIDAFLEEKFPGYIHARLGDLRAFIENPMWDKASEEGAIIEEFVEFLSRDKNTVSSKITTSGTTR